MKREKIDYKNIYKDFRRDVLGNMVSKKKNFNIGKICNRYFRPLFEILGEPILVVFILLITLSMMIVIFKLVILLVLEIEIVRFEDVISLGIPLVLVFWNYLYNENRVNLGYKKEINTYLVNRRIKTLEELEFLYDKLNYSLNKLKINPADIEAVKYALEKEVHNRFWISKELNSCLESILLNLNIILLDTSDKTAENKLVIIKEELKNKIYVEWRNLHKVSSFIATKVDETWQ